MNWRMIVAVGLLFLTVSWLSGEKPDEGCTTDDECAQQCLSECFGDSCRECWDVFISADNHDFYEVKK